MKLRVFDAWFYVRNSWGCQKKKILRKISCWGRTKDIIKKDLLSLLV
jgi:hypothetical protein